MSKGSSLGTAVLAVALALGLAARAEAGAAKHRILYFSQTEGFRHGDGIAGALKVLKEQGDVFEVEECTDCSLWTPEYLARYDAMVSYGGGELTKVNPPLTEANKKALLEFIRGGKGFVAIHSASYMCPASKWPEYDEMLNGVFVNHPWSQKIRAIVEDTKHPATAHLGEAFEVQDEIYQFKNWFREKTHTLLSLDNDSVDVSRAGNTRPDKDYALAWCHPYGQGRVFFTALGHGRNVWNDPRFQTHLRNAVLWALGELNADIPYGSDGRPKR